MASTREDLFPADAECCDMSACLLPCHFLNHLVSPDDVSVVRIVLPLCAVPSCWLSTACAFPMTYLSTVFFCYTGIFETQQSTFCPVPSLFKMFLDPFDNFGGSKPDLNCQRKFKSFSGHDLLTTAATQWLEKTLGVYSYWLMTAAFMAAYFLLSAL